MRSIIVAVAALLLASSSRADIDIRVTKAAAGTVVNWQGGTGPYDVIRASLRSVRKTASTIDLGAVTRIECSSADRTTRGGFEDRAIPTGGDIYLYLVRGETLGYSSEGLERVPASGDCSPTSVRQIREVCERWAADYPERAASQYTGPNSGCTPGTVNPVAKEDARRRTNLYRWLAGLPGITENATYSSQAQEASLIQRGLGSLNHFPPSTAPCYTTTGAEGCRKSNIGWGWPSMARATDFYIADTGVNTLGHRRFILNPPYTQGGFGFVSTSTNPPTWMAQWVQGFGADPAPLFVAWPPPGPVPTTIPWGLWSFSATGAAFTNAAVGVTRLSDGRAMPVTGVGPLAAGYGQPTLAWDVTGFTPTPGEYQVTVTNVTGTTRSSYTYVVHFVDCQ